MLWTGDNLFKRFLAEHRGHTGLTTASMSTPECGTPSVAACGCGAFFESWLNADGQWGARISTAAHRTSSAR